MTPRSILILLFLFAFKAKAQTTITMEKKGGVYNVPCTVNGLNLRFIFDTGASDVSISLAEAVFMMKNNYLTQKDVLGKTRFSTADGNISEGTTIILREIRFGGLVLKDVAASVVNNMNAPLLLGQSAISKLGKIQLDGSKLTILTGKEEDVQIEEAEEAVEETMVAEVKKPEIDVTTISCDKYVYSAYLTSTLPRYMYLFSEKTYTDSDKRVMMLPAKAQMNVLNEAKEDEIFSYVCYKGVKGYISKHLLIKY
ncbi:retropepsin-like aspartic protease family protein [Pedobacter sp. N23S346]|uniref:retropepsin-like aspartic protease family protein n=1 Tax=Pedobacter sp. N23S346 TaxID=3402750 RepID=UPI003AC11A69